MPRRNGFLAGKIIYKYQWRVFQQATLDDHSTKIHFRDGLRQDPNPSGVNVSGYRLVLG
jgi:hypothetical protein